MVPTHASISWKPNQDSSHSFHTSRRFAARALKTCCTFTKKMYKKSIQVHSTTHLLRLLVNLQGSPQMLCNSIHKITASCGPASIKNSAWKRGACRSHPAEVHLFHPQHGNIQKTYRYRHTGSYNYVSVNYGTHIQKWRPFCSRVDGAWAPPHSAVVCQTFISLHSSDNFGGHRCGNPGIQMH